MIDMGELSEYLKSEGYTVTDDGKVFVTRQSGSLKAGDEMRVQTDRDGYSQVSLRTQHGRKSFKIHALVAEFHLPKRPSPFHEVRHLDGIRSNNNARNLAWGTKAENATDRSKHRKCRTDIHCASGHSIARFGTYENGRCRECVRLINQKANERRKASNFHTNA